MKIAVNTRLLISDKMSGIGWFTYHTLKRIVKWNPQHQFIFLFDRKFEEKFIFSSNIIPEVIFPPTRHPVLWYLWFEHSIVNTIKKHQPDIFYSPDGHISLKLKNIPSLPVIHDINYHYYPDAVPYLVGKYYRYYFPRFARHAKRILTVSEYSKKDISETYHIPLTKIDVAYNGANEFYSPVNDEEKAKTKKEYTDSCDYFVYIGVIVPRKNITRMLKAFEEFKKSSGSKTKLLIVGDKLFLTSDIEKAYKQSLYTNDIIFTGRLKPEKLKYVLGAALALVLISYFEGFGIPIVEAMQADVPVITSNVTSMPEIAGEAALFADPYSIDSIKEAMMKMDRDVLLRQKLIANGRIRRQQFTWDKSAESVWNSIEKTISG